MHCCESIEIPVDSAFRYMNMLNLSSSNVELHQSTRIISDIMYISRYIHVSSADCNKWQYESITNGKHHGYKKEKKKKRAPLFVTRNTIAFGYGYSKKKKEEERKRSKRKRERFSKHVFAFRFRSVKEACVVHISKHQHRVNDRQ